LVKADLMSEIADIEMEGHLIDSQMLTRVLDKVMDMGGEFEIKNFRIGQKKNDTSYVQITVIGEDAAHLDRILLELHALGARLVEMEDVRTAIAPGDMVVPRGFYSTTNHPTYVRYQGAWVEVEHNHMDCLIVLKDGRAICTPIGHIKKGDRVVIGTSGVKVVPPERPREKTLFGFMSNEVSSERPSGELVLKALDALFSDGIVKIDTKNYNASRIWKAYGTIARKGANVPDRPWRRSQILMCCRDQANS